MRNVKISLKQREYYGVSFLRIDRGSPSAEDADSALNSGHITQRKCHFKCYFVSSTILYCVYTPCFLSSQKVNFMILVNLTQQNKSFFIFIDDYNMAVYTYILTYFDQEYLIIPLFYIVT